MVIYTNLIVNGSLITDEYNLQVVKSISENNQSSTFDCLINNAYGCNKDRFVVGQNVEIYADKDIGSPITKIFTGLVEDIKFKGKDVNEKINIAGRDYTANLMDRTVEPEVYTNWLAGSIVRDIIIKYTDNITYSGISMGGSISRIAFNQTPVYDAIKQIADDQNFIFYVDVNKNLYFGVAGSSSSGYTLGSSNILKSDFTDRRDTLYNQVWVYGDRYLDGFKETFTAEVHLMGSVFTLYYSPHNTQVSVSGAIIQPGGF